MTTSGCSTARFTPSFYHVLPKQSKSPAEAKITDSSSQQLDGSTIPATNNPCSSAFTTPKNTGKDHTLKLVANNHTHKSVANNLSVYGLQHFFPPAQKKKRRKSRWSTGYYAKKKSISPHVSKNDDQLGSDEEEEDGDDEDEVEKAGEECDEGDGAEEDHTIADAESEPAETYIDGFGLSEKMQSSEEGRVEKKADPEDEVNSCEKAKLENHSETQNEQEKVDDAVAHHLEENKLLGQEAEENHKPLSVNTNKHSYIEAEADNQHPRAVDAQTLNLSKTQTEPSRCVGQEENIKVVTEEEAEQNITAEPMEVEESSTTDACTAARGEEDTGTGWMSTH